MRECFTTCTSVNLTDPGFWALILTGETFLLRPDYVNSSDITDFTIYDTANSTFHCWKSEWRRTQRATTSSSLINIAKQSRPSGDRPAIQSILDQRYRPTAFGSEWTCVARSQTPVTVATLTPDRFSSNVSTYFSRALQLAIGPNWSLFSTTRQQLKQGRVNGRFLTVHDGDPYFKTTLQNIKQPTSMGLFAYHYMSNEARGRQSGPLLRDYVTVAMCRVLPAQPHTNELRPRIYVFCIISIYFMINIFSAPFGECRSINWKAKVIDKFFNCIPIMGKNFQTLRRNSLRWLKFFPSERY